MCCLAPSILRNSTTSFLDTFWSIYLIYGNALQFVKFLAFFTIGDDAQKKVCSLFYFYHSQPLWSAPLLFLYYFLFLVSLWCSSLNLHNSNLFCLCCLAPSILRNSTTSFLDTFWSIYLIYGNALQFVKFLAFFTIGDDAQKKVCSLFYFYHSQPLWSAPLLFLYYFLFLVSLW